MSFRKKKPSKESLTKQLEKLRKEKKERVTMSRVFFIGDLHLDHANIIKYCNRPFRTVDEMNDFIVNAWNKVVGKNDTVYFLGDLAFKRAGTWLRLLNGHIIFIRGCHDNQRGAYYDTFRFDIEDMKFLLVHNPKDAEGWKGWTIHGHTHNNELEKYPLINTERRTVNVSAEMINYTPISLEELLYLIKTGSLNTTTNKSQKVTISARTDEG